MTDQTTLENLAINLFKGEVINNHAWKLDDRTWVQKRKQEWEPIKKRLEYLETSKTKLKTYEKYFLTGKLPKPRIQNAVSVCLLYMCWWHPDQSEENWQLIKDVVWFAGGEYAIDHYVVSYESLIYAGHPTLFTEHDGFPGGFMNGLEERAFNFLIDDDVENPYVTFLNDEKKMKFLGREELPYDGVYKGGISLGDWVNAPDEYINCNLVWQYDRALSYWAASLTDLQIRKVFSRRGSVIALERALDAFASFDNSFDPTHFRSVCVNKVRKILDMHPVPEKLKEMWEQAKAKHA